MNPDYVIEKAEEKKTIQLDSDLVGRVVEVKVLSKVGAYPGRTEVHAVGIVDGYLKIRNNVTVYLRGVGEILVNAERQDLEIKNETTYDPMGRPINGDI